MRYGTRPRYQLSFVNPAWRSFDGAHEGPRSLRGRHKRTRSPHVGSPWANQLPARFFATEDRNFCDDLVPDIRVFSEVCCQARWACPALFLTPRVSAMGRPTRLRHSNTSSVSDVEKPRSLPGVTVQPKPSRPRRVSASAASHTNDGTARKAERFTLLATDCRVDSDRGHNVQTRPGVGPVTSCGRRAV